MMCEMLKETWFDENVVKNRKLDLYNYFNNNKN